MLDGGTHYAGSCNAIAAHGKCMQVPKIDDEGNAA